MNLGKYNCIVVPKSYFFQRQTALCSLKLNHILTAFPFNFPNGSCE